MFQPNDNCSTLELTSIKRMCPSLSSPRNKQNPSSIRKSSWIGWDNPWTVWSPKSAFHNGSGTQTRHPYRTCTRRKYFFTFLKLSIEYGIKILSTKWPNYYQVTIVSYHILLNELWGQHTKKLFLPSNHCKRATSGEVCLDVYLMYSVNIPTKENTVPGMLTDDIVIKATPARKHNWKMSASLPGNAKKIEVNYCAWMKWKPSSPKIVNPTGI